jgi:DNA-binding transcriptional ArsR family regulator
MIQSATMKNDFFALLLQNPLRAKIIRALVHAESQPLTVRDITLRSGSTTRAVTKELSLLQKAKIVIKRGVPATWSLSVDSPHTLPLIQFVRAVAPVRHERIVETLKKAGRLSTVIIAGTFLGDTDRMVDLVLAFESVNEQKVERMVRVLEADWGREIRYAVFPTSELRYRLTVHDRLLRDVLDFSHRILIDKTGVLSGTERVK